MKRQVLVAMLTVAVFGVSCGAEEPAKPVAAAVNGTPKIQFDKTVYDFGTTSMVSKLEGMVVVTNTGDAPLEKLKAQAHCGCTTTGFKVDHLAPGEKTELPFSLAINAMSRGPLAKQITVTSSDTKQPSVNLTLKADIVPVYDFTPQSIAVGNLHMGTTTNATIQVKRTDGKPLAITRVDGAGESVHPKLEATDSVATTATIQVEITAKGAPRNFNESVRIYGENTQQPLMVIPVGGRIVGDITLSREALFWGIADSENWPGQRGEIATTRTIDVTSNVADAKLELSNLSSSLPELKVQMKTITDGKSYQLVAVLDKLPKETTNGTIKFDTNLKSQPSVELKVTINILKRG